MNNKTTNLSAFEGTGIDAQLDGDKLHMVIDLSQRQGESNSGKSVIVASTFGKVETNGVTFNINAYVPRRRGK